MKKIISGILALTLIASNVVGITASADTESYGGSSGNAGSAAHDTNSDLYLVGDMNHDRNLSIIDLALMKRAWLLSEDLDNVDSQVIDMDQDGSFDGRDILLLKKHLLGITNSYKIINICTHNLVNGSGTLTDYVGGVNPTASHDEETLDYILINNADGTQSKVRYTDDTTGSELELDDSTIADSLLRVWPTYSESYGNTYKIHSVMENLTDNEPNGTIDKSIDPRSLVCLLVSDPSSNEITAGVQSGNINLMYSTAWGKSDSTGVIFQEISPTFGNMEYNLEADKYYFTSHTLETYLIDAGASYDSFAIANKLKEGNFNWEYVKGSTPDELGTFAYTENSGYSLTVPVGGCTLGSSTYARTYNLTYSGNGVSFEANSNGFTVSTTNADKSTTTNEYYFMWSDGEIIGMGAHNVETRFRDGTLYFPGFGDTVTMDSTDSTVTFTIADTNLNTVTVIEYNKDGTSLKANSLREYYYDTTTGRICYATVNHGDVRSNEMSFAGTVVYTSITDKQNLTIDSDLSKIVAAKEYTEYYTMSDCDTFKLGLELSLPEATNRYGKATLINESTTYSISNPDELEMNMVLSDYAMKDQYAAGSVHINRATDEYTSILNNYTDDHIFTVHNDGEVLTGSAVINSNSSTKTEYVNKVTTTADVLNNDTPAKDIVDNVLFDVYYSQQTVDASEPTVREYLFNYEDYLNEKTLGDPNDTSSVS